MSIQVSLGVDTRQLGSAVLAIDEGILTLLVDNTVWNEYS